MKTPAQIAPSALAPVLAAAAAAAGTVANPPSKIEEKMDTSKRPYKSSPFRSSVTSSF